MEFNSQICTTEEQSKRLLTLGLKKETADMCYQVKFFDPFSQHLIDCTPSLLTHPPINEERFIPAWSLHRLIELSGMGIIDTTIDHIYDKIIHYIEFLIKCDDFNKEYLEK